MERKDLEVRVQASEKNGTIKFNIDQGDGNEGVWACFVTENDRDVYMRNQAGETYDVFLMNHALIGGPSWGARIKLKASGDNTRSIIPVANVIQQIQAAIAAGDYPSPS